MQVALLGGTEVVADDGTVGTVGGPSVRALLALLALEAGKTIPAEQLVSALYGDTPSFNTTAALQSQVSRLRRELKRFGGRVEFTAAGYRLTIGAQDVDAGRFFALVSGGRSALAAADPHEADRMFTEALELWRGQALADVGDAPFVAGQVATLNEAYRSAVADRLAAWLDLGRFSDAVSGLRELVSQNPLDERYSGRLMRALYGSGRQSDALKEYERLRSRLADELGVDPGAELVELHRSILRAHTDTPARPTASRPPAQLTSFVGRSTEVAEVRRLVTSNRLVTLTGPGGTGKTRLSVEAMAGHPVETCFVDLAQVTDRQRLPHALVTALGLRDTTGQAWVDGLRELPDALTLLRAALADRELVVLLDNAEHLIDAVAELVSTLLSQLPRLRILVTSRETLGITGETLFPVPRLPGPPESVSLEAAMTYPSTTLFADRARAVRPGFAIDESNIEDVLGICRLLDGLPLAIELAAARVKTVAPAEIFELLSDERFGILSRGSRTAAPRHQTLHGVVAWSWDLLDDDERDLATTLAVFTGGGDLAGIANVHGRRPTHVLEILTGLVDKSFVEHDGASRYRMLETIHRFCLERLEESGRAVELRTRHARYFMEFARTADTHLRGRDQIEWLGRIAAETVNLRAALDATIEAGDQTTALRLIGGLSWYWWLSGRRGEGALQSLRLLRDLPIGEPEADLYEDYLLCVMSAMTVADDEPVVTHSAHIEPFLREPAHDVDNPAVLVFSAMFTGPPDDPELVRAAFRKYRDALSGHWTTALLSMGHGFGMLFQGAIGEAEQLFEDALNGFTAVGDNWGMSTSCGGLARVAVAVGNFERHERLTNRARELIEPIDEVNEPADTLVDQAVLAMRVGRFEAAATKFAEADRLSAEAGVGEARTRVLRGMAELARWDGDVPEAMRLLDLADNTIVPTLFMTGVARLEVILTSSRVCLDLGRIDCARQLAERALRMASEAPMESLYRADAIVGLAAAAAAAGELEFAARLLGAANAVYDANGHPDVVSDGVRRQVLEGLPQEQFAAAFHAGRRDLPDDLATLIVR